MLTVVKVGGAVASASAELTAFASAVAALPGSRVVVHGGGTEITAWQERLGLPVEWKNGLRVTTPAAMQVTAMVLSGSVNKRVVVPLRPAERNPELDPTPGHPGSAPRARARQRRAGLPRRGPGKGAGQP